MTGAEFTETIAKPVRDRLRRRQVCARRRRSRRTDRSALTVSHGSHRWPKQSS